MKQEPERNRKPRRLLRPLHKSVYIYYFPLVLVMGWFTFQHSCEDYYHTAWPAWTVVFIFPLILLGITAGVQLEMYLQKTIGKKAEMMVEIVLTFLLIAAFFAAYQYVIVPQTGAPPLTLRTFRDVILKRLHLR
ncbi:MAG: hypothetical protein IJL32_00610 [Oscillospiraceae bacterium]|nr:hypothetical protein [Oscillospiraceae bacterium]